MSLGWANLVPSMSEIEIDPITRELNSIKDALDQSAIVAITDRAGSITHVNRKFCEISKYSREELLGKNHRIINSSHHPREFFTHLWKTISSGQVWVGEVKNRAKDGTFYWVHTTIVPFLDELRAPLKYVSIRFEITQRKEMEKQILLQDRLASVGLLASGLAHDIGSPLGVIRGRSEILAEQIGSNPIANKNLEIIISEIDRISNLIKSLLSFARGQSLKPSNSAPINECMDVVIELMGHELAKHGIRVENELKDKNPILIKGDSEKFQQVLLNLFVNAIHAIEDARKSGRTSDHFIRVSAVEGERHWLVSIADSGCGISETQKNDLFKPFFTTRAPGIGTGLGLVTVAWILQSWGGNISVESQKNIGTVFKLHLLKV